MNTSTGTIDNRIKQIVSNIRNLPTPPQVFHQIQKVTNDPNASANDVAAILAEDPSMSVKVLKMTNSAFYGLAREVESVRQAVVIVGMEAVKNLVLSASVLDMFKADHIKEDEQERFWRHSLATGFACRVLARKVKSRGFVDPEAAFSAGLLHDVGKNVIACFLKDEYEQFAEARAADNTTQDFEVEHRVFGYDHAQVGGVLAMQWKLPNKLCDAIMFHHRPLAGDDTEPLTCLTYLANYLAKRTFYDNGSAYLIGEVDPTVIDWCGVAEEDMDTFEALLREEYLKAETFMQMVGLG